MGLAIPVRAAVRIDAATSVPLVKLEVVRRHVVTAATQVVGREAFVADAEVGWVELLGRFHVALCPDVAVWHHADQLVDVRQIEVVGLQAGL